MLEGMSQASIFLIVSATKIGFFLLPYIGVVAVWIVLGKISRALVDRGKGLRGSPFLTRMSMLVVLASPFVIDHTVAYARFNYLCATSAGLTVEKKIELRDDFFEDDGWPRFVDRKRLIFKKGAWPGGYKFSEVDEESMGVYASKSVLSDSSGGVVFTRTYYFILRKGLFGL